MKILRNIAILIFLTVTLSACAYQLSPEYVDIKKNEYVSFTANNPVTIKTPSLTHKIAIISGIPNPHVGKFTVDLDVVNQRAAEMIGTALIYNSTPITNNAQKTLLFTTKRIYGASGSVIILHIEFELETGSGYKITYDVAGYSKKNLDHALGDAITNAAVKIVHDTNITQYIQDNGNVGKEVN